MRDAELQAAGDRDVHAALEAAIVGASRFDRRAGENNQIRDLSSLQRELDDALLIDHLADARAADVDERGGRFDGDRLFEIPDAERGVDGRRRADLQDESGLHVGAETLQRDLQPVWTGGKIRDHVIASGIGDDTAREGRVGLRGGDRDAWKDGAAFIGDAAVELRGGLRPDGRAGQQEHDRTNRHVPQETPHHHPPFTQLPAACAVW